MSRVLPAMRVRIRYALNVKQQAIKDNPLIEFLYIEHTRRASVCTSSKFSQSLREYSNGEHSCRPVQRISSGRLHHGKQHACKQNSYSNDDVKSTTSVLQSCRPHDRGCLCVRIIKILNHNPSYIMLLRHDLYLMRDPISDQK